MGTRTPWGISDSVEKLAVGINFYGTPSHGGIGLSDTRTTEIANFYKRNHITLSNWVGNPQWWEEDCDWAIPFLYFWDDIEKYAKDAGESFNYHEFNQWTEAAINTAKFNNPDVFEAIRESRPSAYLQFDRDVLSKKSILGG
jgi:hypothetical protein